MELPCGYELSFLMIVLQTGLRHFARAKYARTPSRRHVPGIRTSRAISPANPNGGAKASRPCSREAADDRMIRTMVNQATAGKTPEMTISRRGPPARFGREAPKAPRNGKAIKPTEQ